jgi:hypothetical protein
MLAAIQLKIVLSSHLLPKRVTIKVYKITTLPTILYKCLREIGWGGMDWTDTDTEDRDQWWVLVNMVMNLRVP